MMFLLILTNKQELVSLALGWEYAKYVNQIDLNRLQSVVMSTDF